MGLEEVKKDIDNKGLMLEKGILAKAQEETKQVLKEASSSLATMQSAAQHKLAAETRTVENREKALANMEAQKLLFDAKKTELKNAYDAAWDKIKTMPQSQKEKILRSLLELARKEIDVAAVYASNADKNLFGNLEVKEANIHGIICENKEGTICIDLTFDTLFTEAREKSLPSVSKMLFD